MSNNVVYGITIRADGTAEVVQGAEKIRAAFGDVERGTNAAAAGADRLSESIAKVGHYGSAFLGVSALVEYTRQVIQTADAYTGIEARLRLATTSQQEFNRANAALFEIAQRNGVPLSETIALYSKLAPALRELGGTQQQVLQMSNLVAQSLRLSGAGAAESSASMLQLSQALGSGVLRGDEFNSLMENAPRLMQAMAAGMHQPLGALRAMAGQGQLTADKVTNALLSQKDVLEKEYGQLPLTVSAAWTKLGNSITQEIGRMNAETSGTQTLAEAIAKVADNISILGDVAGAAARTGIALLVASFVAARTEAIATAGIAGLGALRNAIAGLILLYESGGIAALATGILGIGTAARTSTPMVLTLGGALKALIWPAALAYGLYEFASFAEKTFLGVRIGIVALIEQFQKLAAYVSHPFDTEMRDKAIAEIKAQNTAIVEMLAKEDAPGQTSQEKNSPPLKPTANASAQKFDTLVGSLETEAFKKQMEALGATASQIKVYEMAMHGASQAQIEAANSNAMLIDKLEAEKKARDAATKASEEQAKVKAGLETEAFKKQMEAMGASAAQIKVYEMAMHGASDTQLKAAQNAATLIDKLDAEKKAREALIKATEKQFELQASLNAERAGLDAVLVKSKLDDPNLKGDERVKVEREAAMAEEDRQFQIKSDAMAREWELMSKNGTLTEENARAQAQRMQVLEEAHQAKLSQIKQKHLSSREQLERMSWSNQVGTVATQMEKITQIGATKSREMFEINKVASIANAIVDARASVVSAFKFGSSWGGPIGGAAMVALAIAATSAQISAINSSQFGGGTSTVASVGASGGIPSMSTSVGTPVSNQPSAATTPPPTPPREVNIVMQGGQQFFTADMVRNQLIPALNDAVGDGVTINMVAA